MCCISIISISLIIVLIVIGYMFNINSLLRFSMSTIVCHYLISVFSSCYCLFHIYIKWVHIILIYISIYLIYLQVLYLIHIYYLYLFLILYICNNSSISINLISIKLSLIQVCLSFVQVICSFYLIVVYLISIIVMLIGVMIYNINIYDIICLFDIFFNNILVYIYFNLSNSNIVNVINLISVFSSCYIFNINNSIGIFIYLIGIIYFYMVLYVFIYNCNNSISSYILICNGSIISLIRYNMFSFNLIGYIYIISIAFSIGLLLINLVFDISNNISVVFNISYIFIIVVNVSIIVGFMYSNMIVIVHLVFNICSICIMYVNVLSLISLILFSVSLFLSISLVILIFLIQVTKIGRHSINSWGNFCFDCIIYFYSLSSLFYSVYYNLIHNSLLYIFNNVNNSSIFSSNY